MKSYTHIEQSKKLAEFLSLESADMCHKCIGDESYDIIVRPYSEYYEKYKLLVISKDFNAIPCWSLTALLNILPSGKALIHDKGSHGYKCICKNIDSYLYDNPVDACVDLIIKLKEEKLL